MIGLLTDPPQPGYPADYLLARLMARRQRWPLPAAPREQDAATAGWTALAAEFRWLYGQLHRGLRRELAPLFVYGELRPLFLFLRGLASRRAEPGRELLAASLWADDLKRALLAAKELPAALRLLDRAWPAGPAQGRLFASGGLAAVEEGLTRQLLEAEARRRSDPCLRAFWTALVDLENGLALAKRLRWQAKRPFGYSLGGTFGVRCLIRAERRQEPALLPALAGALRSAVRQGVWPLEELLIDRVQQRLHQAERPLPPAGAVAAYIWGAYGTARRLAMAHRGEVRA